MNKKIFFTLILILISFTVVFIVSGVGSSCDKTGHCDHLNEERGDPDSFYVPEDDYWDGSPQPTHGEGVVLQARHGECEGIADSEGSTDHVGSCSQTGWYNIQSCQTHNSQYCQNDTSYHEPSLIESAPQEQGWYEFWSVSGSCCEPLNVEKMDCRDPDDPNAGLHGGGGNRSYCRMESSYAICDSFPTVDDTNVYISSENFSATYWDDLEPEDYFNLEDDSLTAHFDWVYGTQTDEEYTVSDLEVRKDDSNFGLGGNVLEAYGIDSEMDSENTIYYTMSDHLEYDTEYYFRVQTWDETNRSGWRVDSFRTLKRRANVDFVWYPTRPFEAETTYFIDRSIDHGIDLVAWEWDFGDKASPQTAEGPMVSTNFEDVDTPQTITLTVTDEDGYQGSISRVIEPRPELPDWQEIDPF